ncbi:MAG TPA: hypothetical protein VEA61_15100 [Allosphingosinicella sp.]|nr:hypothetical protein [Allosphingosinicella sp.]
MAASTSVLQRLAGAPPPSLRAAALAATLAHAAYPLVLGVRMSPDSQAYAHWSERLVDSGFAYPALIAEASGGFPAILYAIFATLLAALRLLFGDGWATALVVLNFAAHVALGLLVVRLAVRLTRSGPAGWGALLLYLACFDLVEWVPFVLSDSTFVLIAFTVFALAAARILGDSRGWATVLGTAALGVFYRPTGMVLLPDLGWAMWLARSPSARLPRARALAAFGLAATAAALAFAWLVQDPGRWPFDAFAASLHNVSSGYAAGEVVGGRPETYHSPPGALTDFLLISADRFVHFFAIGAAGFSLAHWLIELAFFLPCYALAGWLAAALWRGRTAFSAPERKVFLAAFGAIMSYAFFHALVQVDFDWRYRTPILPHLILLAAGGLADLARRTAAR